MMIKQDCWGKLRKHQFHQNQDNFILPHMPKKIKTKKNWEIGGSWLKTIWGRREKNVGFKQPEKPQKGQTLNSTS